MGVYLDKGEGVSLRFLLSVGSDPLQEMNNSAHIPFSYFHSLPTADQEKLRKVSQWKWAATIGDGRDAVIDHPLHSAWVKIPGNTHSPSHREVMFVLGCQSKNHVYGLAGKNYPRTAGTVFLFDHYEARDWNYATHNRGPFSTLWLHFPVASREAFTYNTVARTADGRSFREIAHRVHFGDAARLIMEAWDRCKMYPSEPLHWELLKSLVTSAILEVLCHAQLKAPLNHQEQVVEFIRRYIEEHYAEKLSLRFLAHLAGYSPFFFHRLFRSHVGETPKDYLSRVRLEKAKELLLQGYTVSAVADAIGHVSPFSFSRFFKDKTGYSPQTWYLKNHS